MSGEIKPKPGGVTIIPEVPAGAHIEVMIMQIDMPLFQAFLRHKQRFEIMLNAGLFDVTDGKATVNYHSGNVQSISVEERRYQHVPIASGTRNM